MRSPGIVVCLLLAFGFLRGAAAAEVSKEARECYQWFATLGFPEVKDAPWVEVWTGGYSGGDPTPTAITSKGYLLKKTATGFHMLGRDLTESRYENGRADEPDYARVHFEPRSFHDDAEATLADLRQPGRQESGHRFGAALGEKAEIFFLSYVCWRKGKAELAEALFAEMKKLPGERNRDGEPFKRSLRQELEAEIGAMETWDAVLRMGGGELGGDRWGRGGSGSLEPRAAVLPRFRRIVRLYPASQYHEHAAQTLAKLEAMVAEDAAHPKLTPEKIKQLPEEKQIAEWIFRLRDQNGHQEGQPAPIDVFDTRGDETSPAHHLLAIGYPAVPQLIAALDDTRLSRTVAFHRDFYFSHGILSVGSCAQQILDRLAGKSFYQAVNTGMYMPPEEHAAATKKAVREWWAAIQEKGERQTLMEEIASGVSEPMPLVNSLRKKYPEAVEAAVLAGAPKAQKPPFAQMYVGELAKLQSEAATEQLVERAARDEDASVRLLAATALLSRGHPAGLPAIIGEWKKFPNQRLSPEDPDFKTFVDLLIASGEAGALRELQDHWAASEADERLAVVEQLGNLAREKEIDWRAVSLPVRPLTPEAREIALALLAHATEDTAPARQVPELWEMFRPWEPRIGDVAVWALHHIEPGQYAFAEKATRRDRAVERIVAANVWRKTNGRELLPLPKLSRPRLAPAQAWRIVNVTIEPMGMKVDEEFGAFLEKFVGTDFDAQTLPKILLRFARSGAEGARGIEVEASREGDRTGVDLNIRPQPGRALLTAGWSWKTSGRIGQTPLSGSLGSASEEKMKSDDAWQDFAEQIKKTLTTPPETEIEVSAEIINGPGEK